MCREFLDGRQRDDRDIVGVLLFVTHCLVERIRDPCDKLAPHPPPILLFHLPTVAILSASALVSLPVPGLLSVMLVRYGPLRGCVVWMPQSDQSALV